MKTMYYSEVLKKYFTEKEECEKAEKEFEEKHAAELKAKEEKTEMARQIKEAYQKYLDLRSAFVKKYGSYHMTLTEKDLPETSLLDLFDRFWF